jgi:hypothetical protein
MWFLMTQYGTANFTRRWWISRAIGAFLVYLVFMSAIILTVGGFSSTAFGAFGIAAFVGIVWLLISIWLVFRQYGRKPTDQIEGENTPLMSDP